MKTLSYSIYFIFLSIFVAQDYIWPTNASNTITAFFAEERPQRYHAGIDIRTYGKNGLEIYAIEDGYIQKIKTDYKGYGKTIYLKLKDGNTAVYAHLEKFYPELDEIVEILKKEYNSSVINHSFGKQELIVKKGQIIGYTGDTGSISGPHLHFEIRDKNNISINPLVNFYKIKDTIAPTPKKIAFIPMNYDTKIDGISDIKLYNIINGLNENEYFINDTISIVGDFGISLNIIDEVNKQPFSYGLYKIELYIDGELKYKIKYDNHNFNEGHIVNEERNYHLKRTENERYYNLYKTEQTLSFIDNRSWPYYKLEPGIHNLVIKASDVNNNEVIIFGSLISEPIEELSFRIKEDATLGNDTKKLALITYDEYLEKYVDQEYAASQTRALPRFVFHGPDLKYGLIEPPDKAYTLVFDYYVFQADLSAHGDTMVIPDRFKHVVVDAAMFHAYMFRGNTQDAVVVKERADEGIKAMRSMLINRYHYMRSYMIPAATGGRRLGSSRSTAGSSLDSL